MVLVGRNAERWRGGRRTRSVLLPRPERADRSTGLTNRRPACLPAPQSRARHRNKNTDSRQRHRRLLTPSAHRMRPTKAPPTRCALGRQHRPKGTSARAAERHLPAVAFVSSAIDSASGLRGDPSACLARVGRPTHPPHGPDLEPPARGQRHRRPGPPCVPAGVHSWVAQGRPVADRGARESGASGASGRDESRSQFGTCDTDWDS